MKKSLKALLIVFSIFASSILIGSSQPAAAAAGAGAGALNAPQSSSDTKGLQETRPEAFPLSTQAVCVLMHIRQAKDADMKNLALDHAQLAVHYHKTQADAARRSIIMHEKLALMRSAIEECQKANEAIKINFQACEKLYAAHKKRIDDYQEYYCEQIRKAAVSLGELAPQGSKALDALKTQHNLIYNGLKKLHEGTVLRQEENEAIQLCLDLLPSYLESFDTSSAQNSANSLPEALKQQKYHEQEADRILKGLAQAKATQEANAQEQPGGQEAATTQQPK